MFPPMIAYFIGLVLALQRKQEHPYSAGLAIWGFLILLVETLFFSCARIVLIADRGNIGMSASTLSLAFNAISLIQVVFFTLGIGLLIGAIFSDRRGGPAARRREPDDFDAPPPVRPRDLPPPVPADQQETTFREKRES
jgi:hypothetical protein